MWRTCGGEVNGDCLRNGVYTSIEDNSNGSRNWDCSKLEEVALELHQLVPLHYTNTEEITATPGQVSSAFIPVVPNRA
jgi:hypothetical protein